MHPLYIQQWVHTQGNETWTLSLQSNGYVVLEGGPHLFEGAIDCTWLEFIEGKLDTQALRYMPAAILAEAKQLTQQTISTK